jgi:phytol kinase
VSPAIQITLALGSVGVLLGLMAGVRRMARRLEIGAEVQRKLIHVATGLYALSLPWLFPDRWPVYVLIGVTLVVMLVLRLPNSRLGKTLHGVERQSYGDLLLALSVGLCLFLAGDDLYLYVLPIAVLTLADAAAALAGSTYGTRFFRIEDGRKSVEGSAVFFLITLLISIVCLMLMTPLPPLNILVISMMVAGFGTLVEAASWRGFDNLFLPLGLLIFLSVHAGNSLAELFSFAGLFVASILAFRHVAPLIGLNRHAAHVYVTAVFLLLAVTAVQNAIIPILVLAAHAWSRSAAPGEARFPDLDIVAALALVSFGWLALGTATGLNAVTFYGVTAIGMVMGLSAVALAGRPMIVRVLSFAIIALVVGLLHALAFALNPEASTWNGPMWGLVLASMGLAALAPSILSRGLDGDRVAWITALSLALPLPAYLLAMGSMP